MKIILAICICIAALMPQAAMAAIIYVDAGATTGTNNGMSWENAYTDLQNALDDAASGDEIWVAQGTYRPTIQFNPDDSRSATFQMKNGIGVYGGFNGTEENRDDRDWVNNVTILSGDIGIQGDDSDNGYIVIVNLGLDNTAILDGVTITGGNGNLSTLGGSGMHNFDSSPTITNCTFSNNFAYYGGGMYNISSSPTLINCTFFGNSAYYGGGMFNSESSPTLTNCIFLDNFVDFHGGGIYNGCSSLIITNCTFFGNSAGYFGGGIYIDRRLPFQSYEYTCPSFPTITITSSIFWGNKASIGNEIDNGFNLSLTYCNIQGGYPGTGNINQDPLFVDPANGNFHLQSGSPCIDAGDNTAPELPVLDFDGDNRIIDGNDNGQAIVDMGADEFAPGNCA
ncbi:MAG: hypothetical protein GY869_24125, partial [Planctomycetes bacterium]|nr:hypothetical protein [Planctomycetota bacterium]